MKRKSVNTLIFKRSSIIFFSCCCFICNHGFSQDSSQVGYVYNFTVRNPKMEILVEQKDSVLYTDFENRLRITIKGKNKLSVVVLEGGEITRHGNNFIAKVKEGNQCILAVYVTKPNGKMELGLSKKIKIVHLEAPIPMIKGVKPDSIIAKYELLESDFLYATMTRFNTTTRLQVLSFEMEVFMDTVEVNYKSMGDRFSPEMRRYVQTLQPGVPLNFKQIICLMPNGTPRKLEDMRLFVNCAPRYRSIADPK
jgi:hypothetical protein